VNPRQITGQVQLQGFLGTCPAISHTRSVTFKATDSSGIVLKTWVLLLSNSSGDTFDYKLTDIPAGAEMLSAKTDWHLRRRLSVTFNPNGQGTN
jgi:hypothetical protein